MKCAEQVWKGVWHGAFALVDDLVLHVYVEMSLGIQNPVDDEIYYGICLSMRDNDRLLE